MPPSDDASLIASCQAGNLEDFDPLYRKHVDAVYRYVYRRVLVRQVAEDIVSDVFLKALEKIGSYKADKGVFVAWLYGIARNALTDHWRSHREAQDIETVWDLAGDTDVELDASSRESYAALHAALKGLDPLKREIVLLRLWEGLPYAEIAALTGKSEANCKMIFSRTVSQLRATLSPALLLLLLLPLLRP